ncbi:MAG: B12-binding domain-containing radical SAM protein, partial [Planctomycetes bacterium]|nr:B12-binding domain-containing radical SAM protein [Planctomycetota bacterium]
MKPKMILINPPTTDPAEPSIYFPMALITLGGVLKKLGVEAEVWDFDLYFKKIKNCTEDHLRKLMREGIRGSRSRVFGISSICSNFPMALWMAREIKECRPDSLVILGGPQPSSVPKETLERFEYVDMIVVGEGEKTLEDIVLADFDPDRLLDTPGVALRVGESVRINSKRALVPNMDDFPFPDYSLVNLQDYIDFQTIPFNPSIEVGRGCPFHCTFCSTSLMWERDFRVKSPARILAEMEVLHRQYGFVRFDFTHDNFTTSRKFVNEFCEYMETHMPREFGWAASSRTDCIDIPRLERMHAIGCSGLFFGVESGSERIQETMKKNLKLDKFEPILIRANELGMLCTTAFILGFPEETEADMDATVLRALHYRALGAHRIFFTKLTALTGTGIYRDFVNQLSEFSSPSTVSQQRYGLPFVVDLIREHPDLFSSYYHVPHPRFS